MKVWPFVLGLAIVSIGVTILSWLVVDLSSEVSRYEKAEKARAARLLPAPAFKEAIEYGAPYNVRVVCTVKGSRVVNGERIPLDPNKPPKPGDVFVKTCLGQEPTGQPTGGPVG